MWAIWLIEPIGGLRPRRAAITPAMKVEATAPMPGVSTPRVPVAGAIRRGRAFAASVEERLSEESVAVMEGRLNSYVTNSLIMKEHLTIVLGWLSRCPICRSANSST